MTIIDQDEDKPRTRVKAGSSPTVVSAQAVATLHAEQPHTMMTAVDRAIEAGLTGTDLQQFMDVQERWEASQARKAFDHAMAQAQGDIPTIVKNRLVQFDSAKAPGGQVSYRHEDLAGIAEVVKPILRRHGLSYRFRTDMLEGGLIKVTCMITGYGHREENSLQASRDDSGAKNNLQAVASTCTYLERYTLKAALGLASAYDDDGLGSESRGTITLEQVEQLQKLIDDKGVNEGRFLAHVGVESLDQISPGKKFQDALSALQNYKVVAKP